MFQLVGWEWRCVTKQKSLTSNMSSDGMRIKPQINKSKNKITLEQEATRA